MLRRSLYALLVMLIFGITALLIGYGFGLPWDMTERLAIVIVVVYSPMAWLITGIWIAQVNRRN